MTENEITVWEGPGAPAPQGAEFGPNYLKFDPGTPYKEWHQTFRRLQAADKAIRWWEGDALNFGDNTYGEKYSQAIEDGDNYSTITKSAYVANRFDFFRRRKNLSFKHHEETAKLDHKEQDFLLDAAEWWIDTTEGKPLSSSTLRVLVKLPQNARKKMVDVAKKNAWSSKQLREATAALIKKLEEGSDESGAVELTMPCPHCGGTGIVSAGTKIEEPES